MVSEDGTCERVSWKGDYGEMRFIIRWGIRFSTKLRRWGALLDLTAGRKASELKTGRSVVRNRHGHTAAAHLDRNDGHVGVSELYILVILQRSIWDFRRTFVVSCHFYLLGLVYFNISRIDSFHLLLMGIILTINYYKFIRIVLYVLYTLYI